MKKVLEIDKIPSAHLDGGILGLAHAPDVALAHLVGEDHLACNGRWKEM
jgi:hypothetical protein